MNKVWTDEAWEDYLIKQTDWLSETSPGSCTTGLFFSALIVWGLEGLLEINQQFVVP